MLRSSQPACNCWSLDRWGCWIELFSDCCFLEMEVKLPCMKFQNLSITLHYITLPTLTSCPLPLLCATSRSNCPWALLLGPLSRDKASFYIIVFQSIFVVWDFLKRVKICPCPFNNQNGPLVIWIDFPLVVSFLNPKSYYPKMKSHNPSQ